MSHYSDAVISHVRVRKVIDDFLTLARRQDFPPIVQSTLCDVDDPAAFEDGPGLYLMYRSDGSIIYVGMSLVSVKERLRRHLSLRERQSLFWRSREPATVEAIIFPPENAWELPSFEEYVIQRLSGRTTRPPNEFE